MKVRLGRPEIVSRHVTRELGQRHRHRRHGRGQAADSGRRRPADETARVARRAIMARPRWRRRRRSIEAVPLVHHRQQLHDRRVMLQPAKDVRLGETDELRLAIRVDALDRAGAPSRPRAARQRRVGAEIRLAVSALAELEAWPARMPHAYGRRRDLVLRHGRRQLRRGRSIWRDECRLRRWSRRRQGRPGRAPRLP